MQRYGFAHLKDEGRSAQCAVRSVQYLHQKLDCCSVLKPALCRLHTADAAAAQYLPLAQCHSTDTHTRNVSGLQLCPVIVTFSDITGTSPQPLQAISRGVFPEARRHPSPTTITNSSAQKM
jgi:hypothetical protein